MKPLLECVPNFSEGQDPAVIEQIAQAIRSVSGVELLEIDMGYSANRTVMTFVGEPRCVIKAAFKGIKRAAQLIDMRRHKGVHPRMGATDVCPLIPIQEVSWEEANEYAHDLAKWVGEELRIPIYLYEKSASIPARKNLAYIRSGEYEGFKQKIYQKEWEPDYGPIEFNERTGQTVIGVRDFLIAYNINLNTKDSRKASKVAREIRESGYIKVENGKKVRDKAGNYVRVKGSCEGVKAIGWYMEEYGIAQVSTNITDPHASPIHKVFEEVTDSARRHGLRVTGSELVGMIPKAVLLEAGFYYLELQGSSPGVGEKEVLDLGVKSLGLADLESFVLEEKVLEYAIEKAKTQSQGLRSNFHEILHLYEKNPSDPAIALSISIHKCLQRISQGIGFLNEAYEGEERPKQKEELGVKAVAFQEIKKNLNKILDWTLISSENKEGLSSNFVLRDELMAMAEKAWKELEPWHKEDREPGSRESESCFHWMSLNFWELAELIDKIFYAEEDESTAPSSQLIHKMGESIFI